MKKGNLKVISCACIVILLTSCSFQSTPTQPPLDTPTQTQSTTPTINTPITTTSEPTISAAILGWRQPYYDAQCTNLAQYEGPKSGKIKWSIDFSGLRFQLPLVDEEGSVFLRGNDSSGNYITGFTIGGQEITSKRIEQSFGDNEPEGLSDRNLVALSSSGVLYALTYSGLAAIKDGKLVWYGEAYWQKGGPVPIGPAGAIQGIDGTLYVGGEDQLAEKGYLMAFSPDGKLLWKSRTGMVAAIPSQGANGVIYAVPRWVTKFNQAEIYSISDKGDLLWKYILEEEGKFASFDHAVVSQTGTVYVHSPSRGLLALSSKGDLLWTNKAAKTPALAPDGSLWALGDKILYHLSVNGDLLKSIPLEQSYATPLVDADGTVYVGCGKKVLAFSPELDLLWQVELDHPYSYPVLGGPGRMYIVSAEFGEQQPGPGTLYCIEE